MEGELGFGKKNLIVAGRRGHKKLECSAVVQREVITD